MAESRIPWVSSHPVAAFVIGAYAFTWLISAPAFFMEESWTPWILIYIGSFGPPVSAAVVTWLQGESVRAWARQIGRWRVGWVWWIAAFGIPVAIIVVTTGILVAIGGPVDPTQLSVSPALVAVVFIFGLTVSGGLNEEPGWRGFAQPYLNDRYSATTASLIVGVVWAFWHLPYFFIPITPHSGFTFVNQIGWFVGIFLLSVILAWAYNNTGSVLIVMVLHAMANTADVLLPLAPEEIVSDGVVVESAVATVTVTQLAVQSLVVVLVVAYFGHRSLSRREIPGVAYLRGEN
ncbi:Membrane protease YdiL, CAAX protease family [Halogeometricum rufum]|uniref:Membrane protease YdiL, CAAX protease family n=1 Tax=Halogeometricum rufum TaxID=553469 RepID=A0A1I6GUH0_9EURY|nr:type II CAAX endopeptidase family protein [Halogeometricum rufum]SFR45808.1 Membrane protease YdiL, CAAX protease family [Halogeometricum rufum]